MDKFEVVAADLIDIVLGKIEDLYPGLKPKPEFLQESEDASILYGVDYYDVEAQIADTIRHEFGTDQEKNDAEYDKIRVDIQ